MRNRRRIIRFFATLVGAYALLSIPWPGVTHFTSTLFQEFGNTFFSRFGATGSVTFAPNPDTRSPRDTEIHLRNSAPAFGGSMLSSSRLIAVLPMAELWALILATPVSRGRRFRAWVFGSLLAVVVIYARLWATIFSAYASDRPYAMYHLQPFEQYLTNMLSRVLTKSMTFGFVFPILIWIVMTLRREDLAAFGTTIRSDRSGDADPPMIAASVRQ